MIKKLGCFFFLLFLTVFLDGWGKGISSLAQAQNSNENIDEATKLVVMVAGKLVDTPTFGAGIIFGWENNGLYIVTADHVVRRAEAAANNLTVTIKTKPNTFFKAELLDHFNRDLDLAVLRLENWQELGIDVASMDMRVLSQPGSSNRGDAVFPVGNPNGVPWGIPVIPDRIAQIVGTGIVFQSMFISSGHSGGGLIDDGGVLTGMIIKDSPPFGLASSIEAVQEQLKEWGYPVAWKLAAGYGVGGKWRVNDHPLFHLLALKVVGNKVSGNGDLLNTNAGGLGVTVKPLTKELAEKYGLREDDGVFVEKVQDDSPASAAGIRREDIITTFNGERVDSPDELFLQVTSLPHAHNFEVKVIRNSNPLIFAGKLGKYDEGSDILVYYESATRVAVRFESPVVFNGDIRGNFLNMDVNGSWMELHRKTGSFFVGFPSKAKFSIAVKGRVAGEAIHFDYKFKYPELGDLSSGKFTAIRVED